MTNWKIRRVLAAVFALCLMFSLAACGSSGASEEPASGGADASEAAPVPTIIGAWANKDMPNYIYYFNEDGTGSYYIDGGESDFWTYTFVDNGDSVTLDYGNDSTPNTFKYKLDGDSLSITDSFDEYVDYVRIGEG